MTTATACIHCGSRSLYEDEGVMRCLACTRPQGEATVKTLTNGSKTAAADPFDQLIDACKTALSWVSERETKANAELSSRAGQRKRIEKALETLTGSGVAATGRKRGPVICPVCNQGYASKAHKAHKETPA